MIPIPLLLIAFLWSVRVVRAAAFHTALWQTKEYRWDRMRAHLSLAESSWLVLPIVGSSEFVILLLLAFLPGAGAIAEWILGGLYAYETVLFFREVSERRLHRPKWTSRAILTFLATVGGTWIAAGVSVMAFNANVPVLPLALIVGDRMLPAIAALAVLVLHPWARKAKLRTIKEATERRAAHPNLTVIGVTGSYGKSTTKEIAAILLNSPKEVLKTPANTNTEIGVAQFVLSSLTPEHRLFVCEMGAYRRGEIRNIAAIVRPTIGVLTAVTTQHLELFGSLDHLKETKYELIAALPESGTAIFNMDDPVCRELAARTKHCHVLRCGSSTESGKLDVICTVIAEEPKGLPAAASPEAKQAGMKIRVKTPSGTFEATTALISPAFATNIALAVGVAHVLKVPLTEIRDRLATVRPLPRTMEPRTLKDGTLVIDDSYSANPEGVRMALSALAARPQKKKIVLLTPMIELGPAGRAAHEAVGAALATHGFERVYVMGQSFRSELQNGVGLSGSNILFGRRPAHVLKELSALRGPDTVILLEGRVPTQLRDSLLAEA